MSEFVDPLGDRIPYGSRYWGEENIEPPTDAYSTCVHPERFDPVAVVGHALVDYLSNSYDIDRTDSIVKSGIETRLTPRSGGGTALTFTFAGGNLPGAVRVKAGWRFLGMWPDCGCDACDDDVKGLLDELEDAVLTIVEGGMSEWRTGPGPATHLYYDDDMNPVGDDRYMPWTIHVEFDGRIDHVSGNVGGCWGADDPEPVELPLEPHRWPAWPRVDGRA